MNSFLNPSLVSGFPHYVIRKSILKFIQQYLPEFHGVVVDLGCGNMPYKSLILAEGRVTKYISIDLEQSDYYQNQPDLSWDGNTIPLPDESADILLATELFEHIENPVSLVKEIRRVLKKGGMLIGTTPFFWIIHEAPNDYRRFTPFGLQNILQQAEFKKVSVYACGGWQLSLGQFLSMYAGFGVNKWWARPIVKTLVYLPVLFLSRKIRFFENYPNMAMPNMSGFTAIK